MPQTLPKESRLHSTGFVLSQVMISQTTLSCPPSSSVMNLIIHPGHRDIQQWMVAPLQDSDVQPLVMAVHSMIAYALCDILALDTKPSLSCMAVIRSLRALPLVYQSNWTPPDFW